MYAGGIVVQTNPLYTEREIAISNEGFWCKSILALDILYPRITKVIKETQIENIIVTGIKDYLPFPKNLSLSIYPKETIWI